jgi:hypothetical protein
MYKKISAVLILVFLSSGIYGNQSNDVVDVDIDVGIGIENINDVNVLWGMFLENTDSEIGAEILIRLGAIGKGNRIVINNLNYYLMEKKLLFRAGRSVDYTLISACIAAIMELGDSSSYSALFSAICAGYPEIITFEALGALEVIPGNLLQFLLNVIANSSPDEKFIAFRTGINSDRLTVSEHGQLAEFALEQALNATEENFDITALRYAAVLALTPLRWTRANALVIRHYYRVMSDFLGGYVSKERFLEAIACLGAVGNSEAAVVLGLQLGLINVRTESTGIFDADITLEIVRALGLIGDNAAFDHLLYVTILPYNEEIIAAAEEAMARLRW